MGFRFDIRHSTDLIGRSIRDVALLQAVSCRLSVRSESKKVARALLRECLPGNELRGKFAASQAWLSFLRLVVERRFEFNRRECYRAIAYNMRSRAVGRVSKSDFRPATTNVPQQLNQYHDVCLFCLFRTRLERPLSRIPSRIQTRNISTNGSRSQGVQAAVQDDPDEDNYAPPRLQNNAAFQQSQSLPEPKPVPKANRATARKTAPQKMQTQKPAFDGPTHWKHVARASTKGSKTSLSAANVPYRLFKPDQTERVGSSVKSEKAEKKEGNIEFRTLNFSTRTSQESQYLSARRTAIPNLSTSRSHRHDQSASSRPSGEVEWRPSLGGFVWPEVKSVTSEAKPETQNQPRQHQLDSTELVRQERRSQRFALDGEEAAEISRNRKMTKINRRLANVESEFDGYEEDKQNRRRSNRASAQRQVRPPLQLPAFISIERLAQLLKLRVEKLMDQLEEEGFEGARPDNVLDLETSSMVAELHGIQVMAKKESEFEDLKTRPPAEDKSILPSRPPIVTIMGHVDHGKTTILDWLRETSVVETEHGGITQHIGAFSFTMPGSQKQITFLDTPGHAAFLEMRRRGAFVTDIVVLVVAADDSVKPQTVEAIKHALAARVPIIVAINKVDKSEANIEKVKQDLSQNKITVEDWGGEYQAVAVSGKTGQGMKELEEAILLLAEVSDFRAETEGPVEGWIIESKVTTAGRVATVLVKRGTLRCGDLIVAGTTWARVRTLRTDAGTIVDEAPPGMPVQVDGWRGDPDAGLEVLQAEDEDQAKNVIELRTEKVESARAATDMAAITASRNEEAEARARVLQKEAEDRAAFIATRHGKRRYKAGIDNEGWEESVQDGGPVKVPFIVKADVAGSVEALVNAVSNIGNHEVMANVVHSGPGQLTESDIWHLAATGEKGYLITFNQPIEQSAARLAAYHGLTILDHNIIYKVTDQVKTILGDTLPPLVTQRILGEAEVGNVFSIALKTRKLKVAGCKITNGVVKRSDKVRVLRGGTTLYTGTFGSLKNVKKDVDEMRKGSECGMGFDNWDGFDIGDQIQCFEEREEKRTLY